MQLSQKEKDLLKDIKDQEQLCIDRYTKHSAVANDQQLKTLFDSIAQTEREHLNTVNQIENGACPSVNSQSGQLPSFSATYTVAQTPQKRSDCYLCTDALSGEKHVSHLYDTCIFEFTDECLRNVLNHIQKEEQQHGKMIYDYMKTNSMY